MIVEDTIQMISDLIDDRTVNELYEERGNSFIREQYDHLVFEVYNYAEDSSAFFKNTVLDIVDEIEDNGIVVFDMYNQSGVYVIETAKG
jgi:hypothetical protein